MKRFAWPAIVLAAVVGLAGCGSGGSSADSGPTAKVMVISVWDNPNYDFQDLPLIVENAAAPVNQAGGINGQRVEVLSCNAKGDPNEAEKCAREAVSEEVVAVVGGFNLDANRIYPILEQSKIPYIGGTVTKPIDSTSPMAFPTAGGPLLALADGVRVSEDPQCNTISYLSSDVTEPYTLPYVELAARHYQKQVTAKTLFPDGTTDMTPFVAQWSGAGADCLIMVVTPGSALQILPAMKTLQVIEEYKGRVYTAAPGGLTEQVLKQYPAETEGFRALGYFPPATDPVWNDYLTQQKSAGNLGKYESKLGDNSEQRTYLAFRVFEEVAKTVNGEITSASLLEALGKACNVNVGPMSPTLDFCQNISDPTISRSFNNSFVWYEARNGVYEQSKDGYVDVLPIYEQGGGV